MEKKLIRSKKEFQKYMKEILAHTLSFHDFNLLLADATALVGTIYILLIKLGYQFLLEEFR